MTSIDNGWDTRILYRLGTDKYSYELNFLPEALPGVSIVSKN